MVSVSFVANREIDSSLLEDPRRRRRHRHSINIVCGSYQTSYKKN
jgi:hypothetical protein